MGRSARARSCVRPAGAAPVAAGPDEVRGPAPVIIPTSSKLNDMTGWPGPRFARSVLVTIHRPRMGLAGGGVRLWRRPLRSSRLGGFERQRGAVGGSSGEQCPSDAGDFVGHCHGGLARRRPGEPKPAPGLNTGSDLGVGAHPRDQAGARHCREAGTHGHRDQPVIGIFLTTSTRSRTAPTDRSNSALSSWFSSISTMRSTPPAPITTGTPT